ncbi:ImmA/IrrE family metallo-endopeptidase [Streptomyces antibioticus]|uniref:ImmA/IrrE family metallo-endopeptidase n=1 Tax=Streptomyces antibioticus TaxID=1890 RepID=UPI003F446D5C
MLALLRQAGRLRGLRPAAACRQPGPQRRPSSREVPGHRRRSTRRTHQTCHRCRSRVDFSTRQSGAPFVFLPSHLDGEQARQHLAHELGQLVLGHSRPGHRDSRTAAAQFASAFLMPRTAVVAAMLRTATRTPDRSSQRLGRSHISRTPPPP